MNKQEDALSGKSKQNYKWIRSNYTKCKKLKEKEEDL